MIDSIQIITSAGTGGNGSLSFRREKFVPRGGPDGGDGGRGGSVYLEASSNISTLHPFHFQQRFSAENGGNGQGRLRKGRDGGDTVIKVPVGTVVHLVDENSGNAFLGDLAVEGIRLQIARGGRGGRGNRRFVSSINQEPLLAEIGERGAKLTLLLELKLLADVGIIGVPNAGKSSLLHQISGARPKVGAYPFTTTEPVLAVVETRGKAFVVAEIPGLLEGAHRGVGLGHKFLQHAERNQILLHLLDGESRDLVGDWEKVTNELSSYRLELSQREQIIAVNKIDLVEVKENLKLQAGNLAERGLKVAAVSALTGEGVEALLGDIITALDKVQKEEAGRLSSNETIVPKREFSPQRQILREGSGRYRVRWSQAERLIAKADLNDIRVESQLRHELNRMGVFKALQVKGIQPGDVICLGNRELLWI